MPRQRDHHILIWMRDRDQAARLMTEFEREGFRSIWAAALPEAVSIVERGYPAAIACTLTENAPPSLMDIETLLAYLKIGNAAVALPPIPIWSCSRPTPALLSRIEELQLPIQLVPLEQGPGAMRHEIVAYLRSLQPGGELATAPSGHPCRVLYMGTDASLGRVISRYLKAAGLPIRTVHGALDVLELLEAETYHALVVDFSGEPAGRALLRAFGDYHQNIPVMAISDADDWLAALPPHRLPRNLTAVLTKPLSVRTLELCLARLLRVPAYGSVPPPANGSQRSIRSGGPGIRPPAAGHRTTPGPATSR